MFRACYIRQQRLWFIAAEFLSRNSPLFSIFVTHRKNPLGFFRNETIAKPVTQHLKTMKSSTLLIIFCVILFIYSIYDIKKSYSKFKNSPDSISITIFIRSVGGVVLSIILLGLHFFGLIPYSN